MASTSTAATASKSNSVKQAKPAQDTTKLQTIAKITEDSINQYFPLLKTAPDILYVSMAIWGMESGWNLHHKKSSGVIDSAHLSPVDPARSTLIGKGYFYADPIRSFVNRSDITAQQRINVAQGFVAHGLSACMGCYHVFGTPNFNSDFKPYFDSIVRPLGMYVEPGQSITGLFPDNTTGMTRSIVAGLIILQNKYKIFLNSKSGLTYQNPARAMEAAIGAYVGKAGSRDINGYSPENRVKDVMYTPSSKLSVLASIGITRTGAAGIQWDQNAAKLASANSASSNTPSSNKVSNDGTRIATSSGDPKNPVGCA